MRDKEPIFGKQFIKEIRNLRNLERDKAFVKGCKYMIEVFEKLLGEEKSPEKALKRLKVIAGLNNTKKDNEDYKLLTLNKINPIHEFNQKLL